MWEELFDLGGKLLLDEWRYVRNERVMEDNMGLRRKNAMVIYSCIGRWRWMKESTNVNKENILNRRDAACCVMLGDQFMDVFIDESKRKGVLQQEVLDVC